MREKPSEWIAISDLMAGVVAVVMLMLVVAVMQMQAAQARVKAAVAVPVPAAVSAPPPPDPTKYIGHMLETFAAKWAASTGSGLALQVDAKQKVLLLANDVLFGSGRAVPSPTQTRQLAALAQGLRDSLVCSIYKPGVAAAPQGCPADTPRLAVILIEGHADRQPVTSNGGYRDNLELSTARAAAVFRAMAPEFEGLQNAQGQPLLGAAGYGDMRPRTAKGRAGDAGDSPEDRRIEIRLVFESR